MQISDNINTQFSDIPNILNTKNLTPDKLRTLDRILSQASRQNIIDLDSDVLSEHISILTKITPKKISVQHREWYINVITFGCLTACDWALEQKILNLSQSLLNDYGAEWNRRSRFTNSFAAVTLVGASLAYAYLLNQPKPEVLDEKHG